MVDVAEGVLAIAVVAVGRPAIVDGDALKGPEHAGGVDRLAAAPPVGGVARQLVGRGAVDPAKAAGDARAGLIEVRHWRASQQLAQALVEVAQPAGGGLDPVRQRAGRDRRAGQVVQQLAGAFIGQVLKDAQVDAQRPDPGAILGRRPHRVRELAGRDVATGATPERRHMLDDPQHLLLGKVEDLARLAAPQALGAGQLTAVSPA